MRAIAVCLLLLLAGCAEEPAEVVETTDETEEVLEVPVEVVPADAPELNVTAKDWYVLPLEASAEGSQAGFRLEIPQGSLRSAWYDDTVRRPIMEVAIIGEGDVDAFHAVAYSPGGKTHFEFIQVNAEPETPLLFGMGGVGVNEYSVSPVSPDLADMRGVQPGDEVALVVGAVGSGDATVGVRFLASDPFASGDFDQISREGADFLDKVEGRALLLEPSGTADGLRLGVYYERFDLGLSAWVQVYGGHMELSSEAPAIGASAVVATAPSHDAGYASMAGLVWTEAHAGVANMEYSAPDGGISELSPLVPDPIVSSIIGLLRGDGAGTGGAELSVTGAGAPTLFPQLYMLAYAGSDASLASLVGTGPEDQMLHYDGLPVEVREGVFKTQA